MRKFLILILTVILFSSCHNYRKDAEQLVMERDSLNREAAMKDSSIAEYLSDFNEILATLDSIKVVEKLVTVQQTQQREMSYSQKQKIVEDINLLNELIQKNKQQVASLQKKLNNSNYKIGKLNAVVSEMEQMVSNLEKQIEEKNTEIARLTLDVQNLSKDVVQLNEKISVIESENEEKSNKIEMQVRELNQVFYVIGSRQELKDNGVIERTGGFLGIGKSSGIKKDFNKDVFSGVDLRELDLLPLNVKKAELLSVHPAGSFHISGEKTADTLFIDNKTQFWSVSKYLVVEAQ